MDDVRPLCPKCGEPAREVMFVTRVRCRLMADGSVGEMLGVFGSSVLDAAKPRRYRCGGGHTWA